MTLATTTRRSAPKLTSTRAPLVVLRQTRFCAQSPREPRPMPRPRWIGELVVRR